MKSRTLARLAEAKRFVNRAEGDTHGAMGVPEKRADPGYLVAL